MPVEVPELLTRGEGPDLPELLVEGRLRLLSARFAAEPEAVGGLQSVVAGRVTGKRRLRRRSGGGVRMLLVAVVVHEVVAEAKRKGDVSKRRGTRSKSVSTYAWYLLDAIACEGIWVKSEM